MFVLARPDQRSVRFTAHLIWPFPSAFMYGLQYIPKIQTQNESEKTIYFSLHFFYFQDNYLDGDCCLLHSHIKLLYLDGVLYQMNGIAIPILFIISVLVEYHFPNRESGACHAISINGVEMSNNSSHHLSIYLRYTYSKCQFLFLIQLHSKLDLTFQMLYVRLLLT